MLITGSAATGNLVLGNFIGIRKNGETALPNPYGVLVVIASSNIIGGSETYAGNVISGNTNANVYIGQPTATANIVKGNHIGTNAAGSAAVPTAAGPTYTVVGIDVNGTQDSVIGGPTAIDGNLISGNSTGINLDNGATGTEVENNLIGTDATGLLSVPNAVNGVSIDTGAVDNTIGPANTITNSGAIGVSVDGAATLGNQITLNSIFSNTVLGISLTNGGNALLPAPVMTSAFDAGSGVIVVGTYTNVAQPTTVFMLEFFSDPVNEAGGKTYIGSKTVTTDGFGEASFTAFFSGVYIAHGQYITATATDPANDTSPFSNASGSYNTARVIALNNRAVFDPVISAASSNFMFVVFGKVSVVNDGLFTVDDGSGKPVNVYVANHNLANDRFVRVRGMLSGSGSDTHMQSTPELIEPLN